MGEKNVGAVLVIEDNLLKRIVLKNYARKIVLKKKLLKILLYMKSWREMLLRLNRQIILIIVWN
jgi:hypothetical protein